MQDAKSKIFLPKEFLDYIALNAPRADIIQGYLKKNGVDSTKTIIEGKNHILVQFAPRFYNPRFRIKTVVAHYDRVENSPGANDNSAADWQIMSWAISLSKMNDFHNVRIFFTDGEELGWNTGVKEQGSYGIASIFKRLSLTNDDIYVFDACGRGDVPILAKTRLPAKTSKQFLTKFNSLYDRAQTLLFRATQGRWMALPVPYSDNAAFLACGIPAVAITMLPSEEASLYAEALVRETYLEDAVMNRELTKNKRKENGDVDTSYKKNIPQTWKLFHTMGDNIESLTEGSFRVMSNILNTLAITKTPIL